MGSFIDEDGAISFQDNQTEGSAFPFANKRTRFCPRARRIAFGNSLFILNAASIVLGLLTEPANAQTPQLILEEIRVVELDTEGVFSGLAVSPTRDVFLLWSSQGGLAVLADSSGICHELWHDSESYPTGAGFRDGGRAIEILDGDRQSILRMDRRGDLIHRTRFSVPVVVTTSAITAAGWLVGGWNASEEFVAFQVGRSGDSSEFFRFDRPGDGPPGDMRISVLGDRAFFTQVSPPHKTTEISKDGKRIRSFQPMGEDGIPTTIGRLEEEVGRWVSLPILPLDHGFLQMLSDLNSDRRTWVLSDSTGMPLRSKTISVPLAFHVSWPEEGVLFGVRRLNSLEVLEFGWRWSKVGY